MSYLSEERRRPLQADEEEEKTENHEVDDDSRLERCHLFGESTHRYAGDCEDDESHQPSERRNAAKRIVGELDHVEEFQLTGSVLGEKVGVLKCALFLVSQWCTFINAVVY